MFNPTYLIYTYIMNLCLRNNCLARVQASFSQSHKKIPAGNYVVRVFDEEGYSSLRKVRSQILKLWDSF